MAATTLIDVRLLSGGYEISSDHNQGTLTRQRDAVEATTFGNGSQIFRPGLKQVSYTLNGYFDAGSSGINDIQIAQWDGTTSNVLTIVAPDGATGAAAYSFESVDTALTPFAGSVGDMAAFTVTGTGTGESFRGTVVEDGNTARSASGNTSEYLLGDVAAGETLYAALHVIAVSGSPTLDVTIQSDTTGFLSPTTHITFPQATTIGDGFQTSTTVTTDTYWRAAWTFGGTGSITFLVNIGIH